MLIQPLFHPATSTHLGLISILLMPSETQLEAVSESTCWVCLAHYPHGVAMSLDAPIKAPSEKQAPDSELSIKSVPQD